MFKRSSAAVILVVILALGSAANAQTSTSMSDAVLKKFTEEETKYQLPPGVMAKIAKIESNGNVNARAQTSSAAGLFQWLTGSWYTATQQLYGAPKHPDLRFNPFVASEVTGFNLRHIQNTVGANARAAGADMQVALYMGHFLGAAGAGKFFAIMATPQGKNASAAAYFPQAAAANRGVFGGRTIAGVYNFFAAKMQQPGITGVTNYTTDSYTGAMTGRIMDSAGSLGLAQAFTAARPTGSGTSYDYPTTYNQQQDSVIMNSTALPPTTTTPTPSPSPTGTTNGGGTQQTATSFAAASLLLAQPAKVMRGFPIVVAWATVGVQTCSISVNGAPLVEGTTGSQVVSSNLAPTEGGTLIFTMLCQTRSGGTLQGVDKVTVLPSIDVGPNPPPAAPSPSPAPTPSPSQAQEYFE